MVSFDWKSRTNLVLGGLALAMCASLITGPAAAEVFIGVGVPGYYAPYPYVYAPPPVIYPPPVQNVVPPVLGSAPPSYWYYCDNPEGYYPYIGSCSSAWRPVQPAPAH